MARPRREDNLWLMTYADLVTAVLAVLVMIASFTRIDVPQYDEMQRLVTRDDSVEPLSEVEARIRSAAQQAGVQERVATALNHEGLTVSFDTAALFDSGSADLDATMLRPLHAVFEEIVGAGARRWIDIQGHTDDVPFVDADGWNRNWSLSAQRAIALHRHLWRMGLPERATRVLALADTEPVRDPRALAGADLQAARALNRRVSLLVREVR